MNPLHVISIKIGLIFVCISELKKILSQGTDTETSWVKKGGETIFGFNDMMDLMKVE